MTSKLQDIFVCFVVIIIGIYSLATEDVSGLMFVTAIGTAIVFGTLIDRVFSIKEG